MTRGRASLVAAAVAALVPACADPPDPCGDASTCVDIYVDSPTIHTIDQLTIDVTFNGTHSSTTTGVAGEPQALPTRAAVILDLPDPPLIQFSLLVAGKLNGDVIAGGTVSNTVQQGSRDMEVLELFAVQACTEGALYCGGFDGVSGDFTSLYVCTGGFIQFYAPCAHGCTSSLAQNGVCFGDGLCVDGGTYCGGDQLDGDPKTLYVCHSFQGTSPTRCPTACIVSTAGHDFCR